MDGAMGNREIGDSAISMLGAFIFVETSNPDKGQGQGHESAVT
jgi:hypothetical protein